MEILEEFATERDTWLMLEDEALLRLCRIELCRGTGPGGQKRNKTSTSVRLIHLPTGINAENDVTRSQHQNKTMALNTLRMKMAIALRKEPDGSLPGEAPGAASSAFPLWSARLLDILFKANFRFSEANTGLSTGRLVKCLAKSPMLWQTVNQEREKRAMTKLRL